MSVLFFAYIYPDIMNLLMQNFSDSPIGIATATDCMAIKNLLNSAYRGESSKQGWTTEAHLIAGDVRTDEANVLQVMQQQGSVFLKYCQPNGQIIGCVNLQQHGHKMYLGMFSVSPTQQGSGIGKLLLGASEEYAAMLKCNAIYMTVIADRKELIHWYMRHGYKDTGERKPFYEDGLSGKHLKQLEFMVLEKTLL